MKKNKNLHILLVLFLLCLSFFNVQSQTVSYKIENNEFNKYLGKHFEIYTDNSNLDLEQIKQKTFKPIDQDIPNLYVTTSTYWLRTKLINKTPEQNHFLLQVAQPAIDFVDLYLIYTNQILEFQAGDRRPFSQKVNAYTSPIFPIDLELNDSVIIYLKVSCGEHLQVPINIGTVESMTYSLSVSDIIAGLYIGIILVMFLYNLFIYFSTKDRNYLYYVVYIFIVGLAQLNFQGYAAKLFWPNNSFISTYAVYILSSLVALSSLEFMRVFLHTKEYVPKFSLWIKFFYALYSIAILTAFLGYLNFAYLTIQITASTAATYMLICAILVLKKGYRPAKFFLYAWSVFLVGVLVYVFKDYGILPFNNFSVYLMPLGTAVEVVLLSFALADRINTLKKEKEESQLAALLASQENEKLVKEQNIELEQRVKERTKELEETNESLVETLKELKDAQTQLVESEKMASLGQLTAGIAHEINNPINFVSSNIRPLQRDFKDLIHVIDSYGNISSNPEISSYFEQVDKLKKDLDVEYLKDEISALLSGIEDGAKRTSEIVKGLKTFSRLDESDIKVADIHEGLDSTLVLLRSVTPDNIEIIKDYGVVPKFECYAGKLNQVFMNILSNGIQAIKTKPEQGNESITIKTRDMGEEVLISIKDSGPGMSPAVKERIFDPFFTTKDVGEGTGLGLSIVFKVIQKHRGHISVESEPGKGAEFIIRLPKLVKDA